MPPFNHFTTKAKEAVRRAHELAVERGQNQVSPIHLLGALLLHDEFVSTEHLFIAVIDVPGAARDLLSRFRITRESVLRALQEIRSQKTAPAAEQKKFRALQKYTRSLTKAALENKLDPVIGRDEEIQRVIQILSRRTKNNPILIGEAGV